ncbi:MAG: 2-amino-5-chloromuconate deaminase CnbZ, partial [Stellaceae bacterium]
AEWGIYDGKTNPVARSNVCPEIDPPSGPSFYGFSFTRPSQGASRTFVIAGSGEAQEGAASYAERTVRYRDLSPEGIAEKARYVVGVMEKRMAEFGFGWQDATVTQTYTVHDFHPAFADAIVRRGAARAGLTWHFARPPVIDLEYEMDCRRVMREVVI